MVATDSPGLESNFKQFVSDSKAWLASRSVSTPLSKFVFAPLLKPASVVPVVNACRSLGGSAAPLFVDWILNTPCSALCTIRSSLETMAGRRDALGPPEDVARTCIDAVKRVDSLALLPAALHVCRIASHIGSDVVDLEQRVRRSMYAGLAGTNLPLATSLTRCLATLQLDGEGADAVVASSQSRSWPTVVMNRKPCDIVRCYVYPV